MTAKHTPGPWTLGGCSGRMIVKPRYGTIAEAESGISDFDGRAVIADTDTKANARLIVAAPELLAMLIDLREQGGFENLNSLEECDALIAKATGEDAP